MLRSGFALLMSEVHPAAAFVVWFHDQLSRWFSGEGNREEIWTALVAHTPPEMAIVYPSGKRLSGQALLRSIEDGFATSPGFRAIISELEVVLSEPTHAVVSYTETQQGARRSRSENTRSALALVIRDEDRWTWRFIQETATEPRGDRDSSTDSVDRSGLA